MKNVTIDELRELCDELKVVCRKDGDTLLVPLYADEDEDGFDQNFTVFFDVLDNCIRSWASISEYGTSLGLEKMNEFCNLWNDNRLGTRAFIDSDKDFCVDYTLWTDEDVSKKFITENFVQFSLCTFYNFFAALKQYIEGKNPFEEDLEEDSETDVEEVDNSSNKEAVEN